MVVDERSRHEMYRKLEEVLGPDAATTLIAHMPPVGWADVATRHDLANLEQRIDLRFARVDDRFDYFEERMDARFSAMDHRIGAVASDLRASFEHELRSQATIFQDSLRTQTMTMVFALVSVVLTMAALAFALVRFT